MVKQTIKKAPAAKINLSPYWHQYLKNKAGTKYKLQGLIEELISDDAQKPENKKFLPNMTN